MKLTFLQKFLRIDWILFIVMMSLACASVAFIYSATYTNEVEEYRNSFRSQMYWIPIGLAGFFFFSMIDYRFWLQWAPLLGGIALLGLILVHVPGIGYLRFGARNWIHIGPFSIQPAELAKMAYIIFLTWYLLGRGIKVKELSTFMSVIALMLVPVGLILKQPDLGSAAVFLPTSFVLMYVAGVRFRYLFLTMLLGGMVVAFSYFGVYKAGMKIPGLKEYQLARIKMFYDPSLDPKGRGWQINQSLIAIGSGGSTGKGYLKGTQNVLGYLPKKTSYNDFIFSVIGEEWGFVGGSCVIGLEGLMLLLCLRAGASARDQAGCLITCGVMAMLFTHIFVNIGMSIQVVPITGIPLPFISYGGTFLVVCMSCIGLVQSVWIHRKNQSL